MLPGASRLLRVGDALCIGTYTKGMGLWSPRLNHLQAVPLPEHDPEEPTDEVFDVHHDHSTGLDLVLSHRRGLFVADPEGRVVRPATLVKADVGVHYTMEQVGNDLLLSGSSGVHAVNPSAPETMARPVRDGCEGGTLWVRADPDGGHWRMTSGAGLYRSDPVAGTCLPLREVYPQVAALMGGWPLDVFIDQHRRRWFLSAAQPPVVLFPDGHAERITGPSGLAPFEVCDIAAAPDGRIWLAVKHTGIAMLPAGSPSNGPLPVEDRSDLLCSRNLTGLVAMRDGSLWCTLPNALQYVHPDVGSCRLLTVADGVPSGPLNLVGAQAPLDPPLLVGTYEGFVRVTEAALAPVDPPAVQLPLVWAGDSLVLRNADIAGGPVLELPSAMDRVSIVLRSTNLIDPERDAFAYRLLGGDTAWTVTGAEERITFNSLAHGRYRFEVKARTDGGPWGPVSAFRFTVLPPFWATWWFRSLVVLAIAGVALLAFRIVLRNRLRRARQQLERERAVLEERVRIARDLHDDLGSGLASIGMESELASLEAGDRGVQEVLKRVGQSAREVGDDMRRIVWALGSGQETLGDLVAYVRGFAGELLDQAGIAFEPVTALSDPGLRLTVDQRRHLLLLTKEALTNVVRHAAARRVRLVVRQHGGELTWAVEDDGRGFDPAARSGSGTGSGSMQARALALGGALQVRSAPGEGTTVSLTVRVTVPAV
jgi:signal transduction histidine kinase